MDKKIIRMLDSIMDNFDFESVKKTMDALEWKWVNLERYLPKENFAKVKMEAIPTLDEIKQHAANLLWELANDPNPEEVMATGGFVAEKDFSDPKDLWMELSFKVTEWNEHL